MTVQTPAATVRPLFHNQNALLLAAQTSPESAAYNVYATVRIPAAVDLVTWQAAWEQAIARHNIFHSTYATGKNGEPVAIVSKASDADLSVVEVSGISEVQLQALILAEADRPFDLETDPVLRVRLYRRSDREFYKVIILHEIAGELRSLEILLKEFRRAYSNLTQEAATSACSSAPA